MTNLKTRAIVHLATAALLISAASCVFTPYDNQSIADTRATVSVSGWTVWPADKITVYCRRNGANDFWASITSTVGSSSPHLWEQATVYEFNTQLVIPRLCWSGLTGPASTELQFAGGADGKTIFAVFDSSGVTCIADKLRSGLALYDAREACRLKTASGTNASALRLRALAR
jgi:hypothetical protein